HDGALGGSEDHRLATAGRPSSRPFGGHRREDDDEHWIHRQPTPAPFATPGADECPASEARAPPAGPSADPAAGTGARGVAPERGGREAVLHGWNLRAGRYHCSPQLRSWTGRAIAAANHAGAVRWRHEGAANQVEGSSPTRSCPDSGRRRILA